MSRLLVSLDGTTMSIQDGALPPDRVLIVRGSNVAVLNVDLAMPDASGLPRVDYARRFNVIPSSATEEQAVAIFRAGWRRGRETSGGSYDDAGIGALSDRTAILYGVDELLFRNWYARNYIGVKLQFEAMP